MRVFHQHFGASRLTIDPYQFGAGNTEAILSGAFWFYYRFGFRPVDEKLCALADAEHARIRSERGYRSPAKVLRRLASAKLVYVVEGARQANEDVPDLPDIGLAVTQWIGRKFRGDRRAAEAWACRRAARMLGVRGMAKWPADQQTSFANMSVLIALIPDVPRWSKDEKTALVALMRAKGGPREYSYARKLQRHARLRKAMAAIAKQGQQIGGSFG
jgi:hypothetical protein